MLRTAGLVAAVAAAVLAAVVVLAWVFQRQLVYLPGPSSSGPAAGTLPGAHDVVLRTQDGVDLGAWLVPPRGRDRGVAVLVLPGNAGDRSLRAPLADALAGSGLTVLLMDYRGYGGNPGSPSEEGLALDARAGFDHLVTEAGVSPGHVLVYGESLGAAVAARLATERPTGPLLLRSPFTDLAAVGSRHDPFLPVRTLLRDRFPLREHLRSVDVPVAVVLGTRDRVVPPEESRAVAAAAPDLHRLVEVPGAGHNDPALLDGAALVAAVVDLAAQATR